MVQMKAICIAILMATFGVVAAKDIPEFLHICQTKDPKVNICIAESIEFLRPSLKSGVPDYNVDSIEPIKLDSFEASPMNSMKLQLHEATLNGISNFQIKNLILNIKTLNIQGLIFYPYINFDAIYDIDGKIFILPIKGSGPAHGNFSDNIVKTELVTEILTKNNEHYFHIKEAKLKLTLGKGYLKLENLLGGKTIGEVINESINSNLDLFMQNIIPPVEKALASVLLKVANKIVTQFSFSQLFPDYTIQ